MNRSIILYLNMALISTPVSAANFLNTIRDFNWPVNSSCEEYAATIANNLEIQNQVHVEGSICEIDPVLNRPRAQIRYTAESELNLVSTFTRHNIYIDRGTFDTKEGLS